MSKKTTTPNQTISNAPAFVIPRPYVDTIEKRLERARITLIQARACLESIRASGDEESQALAEGGHAAIVEAIDEVYWVAENQDAARLEAPDLDQRDAVKAWAARTAAKAVA